MKYIKLSFVLGYLFAFSISAFGQEDLSVYNYWKYDQNSANQYLYDALSQRAFSYLKQREVSIAKLSNKADWEKRQVEVRAKLAKAVGPFPERTPLNPVVTGIVKKEGFTVEKMYYESRPGYYVTAAMFIPEKKQAKAPAIIYCSGHSDNGYRSDAYQHIILNYVKKGFVVLAFDPIGQGERIQYEPIELKKGGVNEHSFAGVQSFVSGVSSANYFIWDGIRTVDYLLTRKEVDPTRIGIAGRSGGGTQTAYIAAMDDRILASAPECYITSFDKLIRSNGPQDAEQNLMYGLKNGLDMADFLEVRAPKPTLIVATTRDIFSIQGTRDTYNETRKAYQALGKVDNIQLVEDDAGHASTLKNREASYAFFQKHLNNPGSSVDEKVDLLTEKELNVTPNGLIIPFLKGESMFSINKVYANKVVENRERYRKSNPDFQGSIRQKVISISGYTQPKNKNNIVFSGRIHREGYAIEKYLVQGSEEYSIPLLWLKPTRSVGKTILLLDEQGKAEAVQKERLADQLVTQGYEVVIPDLSGIGELGNGYIKGGDSVIEGVPLNLWFSGILVHKNLLAIRAEEITILADVIKKEGGVHTDIIGLAVGNLTSDLLHAATIVNPFQKLVLINPLISYQSITEERLYKPKFALSAVPSAIVEYDLPDLVDILSRKGLLVINPVTATNSSVDDARINDVYQSALKKAKANSFRVENNAGSNQILESVSNWIKN